MWSNLYQGIKNGDDRSLARAISLVENEAKNYLSFLQQASYSSVPIIGVTGPPGAGKSSLTNALIRHFVAQEKKIAVLCIDPSSPFHLGALLGDRLRMEEWYLHPKVFIRSLASRGALGGLNAKTIEIADVLKMADFDFIIVETVGVGQSEIDIVGLADTTIVVLVPESGDEIQTMKAGLMEVADIFVVNKADRPEADLFYHNLKLKLAPTFSQQAETPIIKTVATKHIGIQELADAITHVPQTKSKDLKIWNWVNKACELIQKNRMKDIDKKNLYEQIQQQYHQHNFHLYQFIEPYLNH